MFPELHYFPSHSRVVCFPNTSKGLPTPLGILRVNSVWHYLPGVRVRIHRLRAQPLKTTPASDTGHRSQVATYTSDRRAVNRGLLWPNPSSSILPWNGSQNSGKCFIHCYRFVIKNSDSRTANGRAAQGRDGMGRGVPSVHTLCGCLTLPVPQRVRQLGGSLNAVA